MGPYCGRRCHELSAYHRHAAYVRAVVLPAGFDMHIRGVSWFAPKAFGASPAAFPCGHVFDGVRTQRRIRRIGIRYNGAIVAAGYGRFLCLVSGGVFGRPHGALPLASHIRIIALKRAAGVNDKAR